MKSIRLELRAILCAACLAPMVLAGCGKAAEVASEKMIELSAEKGGAKVNVDIDAKSGTFTMTGKDEKGQDVNISMEGGDEGKMTINSVSPDGAVNVTVGQNQIPENFPKDVPLYTGINVQSAMSMAEKNMFNITGTVDGSMSEVSAYYKKEAAANGWEEKAAFSQAGQMETLQYGKESRVLSVMVMDQGGKTMIQLSTGQE